MSEKSFIWGAACFMVLLTGCGGQEGPPPPPGDFSLSIYLDSAPVIVGNTSPAILISSIPKMDLQLRFLKTLLTRRLAVNIMKMTCCLLAILVIGLGVSGGNATFVNPETRIPGKQLMVANFTTHPPAIDGVFRPDEWIGAFPVYVDGSTPATPPGIVPSIPWLPNLRPPDSPRDSSFVIYTLYDENYLYVGVNVTDDIVIADSPNTPWLDDDVEVMVDGDRQTGDITFAEACGPANPNCPIPVVNNEGFKVLTSAGGVQYIDPPNNPSIVWDSKVSRTPTGFFAEFRISLDSINTIDTSWWSYYFPQSGFRRPQPGDTIGFNVAVGDDDNGGDSYARTEPAPNSDSFTAWDGRSVGWYVFNELDWGNLYFAPHR